MKITRAINFENHDYETTEKFFKTAIIWDMLQAKAEQLNYSKGEFLMYMVSTGANSDYVIKCTILELLSLDYDFNSMTDSQLKFLKFITSLIPTPTRKGLIASFDVSMN